MCLNHGSQSPFRNKRGCHLKRKGVREGERGDNKCLCGGEAKPLGRSRGNKASASGKVSKIARQEKDGHS